ncbi:hypothetical protein HYH03_011227 [Edaphochlamys debaryana]|uniref:Uncharacterized protein n=1 Tax=Edaphochlamys debaryana TaxID=47281 RepID=A0A835XV00_9CHLO|nr:hypothetical protein HYH03_011227 [Edaphochlamys debaryana]|eukprot:KAG2490275.1 hypothetical protein HYH03_011227 [Edaphochlamys debaryana]
MASAASVLPPVTEALSLLDVSFVNNEWHGTPATIRRSIQILVDHISVQNMQMSRVEDILAAFGNPTQQGGTVWSKLATKADLSRLEKLEAQVDSVLNDCAQLRSQQSAAAHARDDTASRLDLLREALGSLEARLGTSYAPDSSGCDQYGGAGAGRRGHGGGGGGAYSPSKLALAAAGGRGVPSVPTGSILDRISRLERRADALAEMGARAEDESSMLVGRLREMEPRIEAQLGHLRGDIKQALALAAASTRMEADVESSSRVKEAEKRLLARLQSVEAGLEGKIANLSAASGVALASELDKRLNGVYDHVDMQVQRLGSDVDRLARDKVDLASLEHYSQRVSALFENVAGGLADEVAALAGQLRSEVAGVGREVEEAAAKGQALQSTVREEAEGLRALSEQVKEAVAAVQESLSATPRMLEENRSLVRQAMSDSEQLQRAVAGLNSAMSSTSSALELQSHKLGQVGHKLAGLQQDVAGVKDTLFGGLAAAAAAAAGEYDSGGGGGGGPSASGSSLVAKIAALDRAVQDLHGLASGKADDALARDLERRLASLSRQADVTAEGLRSLSSTAFKRADEHASAIQRLTLAVTGNLEERPTTTTVKHLIETAALEVRERCDNALAPLWDAVRILQSGLRDAAGELKAVGAAVGGVQQAQTDARSKVATDRSSVMAALRKALDDEVGALRSQVEARLSGMEGDIRQAAEQLELHAQLQDRLTRLTTAVEEQLATQVAAWRTGTQQLRSELGGRVEAAAAGLGARLEAVEAESRRTAEDLQAVTDLAASKPGEAAVRELCGSLARSLARQELARYAEKDEMKWTVWLEEQSRHQSHLVTQGDLTSALETASRQIKQELDGTAMTRADELRRGFASLRGEVDARLRATGSKVEVQEMRVQDLETAVAACASKKEVEELVTSVIAARADRAGLEARLQQVAEEAGEAGAGLTVLRAEAVTRSEMNAELARKVDLAAYLAQGSARAAAANAGALVGAAAAALSPPPSPPRRAAREDRERDRDRAAGALDLAARAGLGSGAAAAARAVERLRLGGQA